jgi:hypothetical protein
MYNKPEGTQQVVTNVRRIINNEQLFFLQTLNLPSLMLVKNGRTIKPYNNPI